MGQKSRSKKNSHKQKASNKQATQQRKPVSVMPASLSGGEMPTPVASAAPRHNAKATVMDIQTEYIRTDIIRIALLLAIVALVIVAAYLFGQKTSYLDKAGTHLSSFFKLQ